MVRILLFLVITMASNITQGQELDSYRWKNRVVLLLANQPDSETYARQIKELGSDPEGLEERRLIIFCIEPDRYCQSLQDNHWQKREKYFKGFKATNDTFELVLIGLDGGIKMRQSTLVSNADLFALIDGMPMRQQEIRMNHGSKDR